MAAMIEQIDEIIPVMIIETLRVVTMMKIFKRRRKKEVMVSTVYNQSYRRLRLERIPAASGHTDLVTCYGCSVCWTR